MLIKMILPIAFFSLMGCHNPGLVGDKAGPLNLCPNDQQQSYYRKSMRAIESFAHCFEQDVRTMMAEGHFNSYLKWLILSKNYEVAEAALFEAITLTDSPKDFWIELAKLNAKQQEWDRAQHHLELAGINDDDPLMLKIIARTEKYPIGFDAAQLPYIFQSRAQLSTIQATVIPNDELAVTLTRVDTAEPGVLASETSIVASADGKHIWTLWTDSSGPGDPLLLAETWKVRAARSSDGGLSWQNEDFSIEPELKHVYHFDPMTAYDPTNEILYAGALTTTFNEPNFNTIYLKSWDLEAGSDAGPYIQNISTDKVWMTTDDNGGLFMTEGLFKDYFLYSDDFGMTFESIDMGVDGQLSPYPEVGHSGCLHVIDYNRYTRCNGLDGYEEVIAPNTSLDLANMGDFLPGGFRALPLRLIAFHPNGDTFIIYPDLETKLSDEIAIWMTRSTDGDTWSTPWIISPDVPGDRFLPWLEIDQQGGIHVSYADTRNNIQPDNGSDAFVDMYYSFSNDLGQSWQETRITPTPLEVPQLTWGEYFYGDYLEMALANSNTLFLAFPWFQGTGDMDLYVAKIQHDDLIFMTGFE